MCYVSSARMRGTHDPPRVDRVAAVAARSDEVERALDELHRRGQARWPELALEREALARFVARHAGEAQALAGMHAEDMYLACACVERVRGAVKTFEAQFAPTVEAALRRLGLTPAQRDEVRQTLWEKLFVAPPAGAPKIADYAGRGPLGGWVRVAAIRTAQNALRKDRQERLVPAGESGGEALPDRRDPEEDFLKSHYRGAVRRALTDALGDLSPDERNVLRLALLDGLGIDRIAAVYGVHRATAARWIARGREALLRRTQALLEQRCGIGPGEVDEILGLVRSQMDVSPRSLFSKASEGTG